MAMDHPRISQIPGIMGGKACIEGTRIPIDLLLDYLSSGDTIEGLLEGYPDLTREDVFAALAFAADHLRTNGFAAVGA